MKIDLLEMSETMYSAIREDFKTNKGYVFNWNELSCCYDLSEEFIKEF